MTQKKLLTSSKEGSEYRQQVWCESIKDVLRYDKTLFGGSAAVFDVAVPDKRFRKSKIILIVR